MGYQTLADDNQFQFKCPIFNADTKMATCIKLRNMVWKGLRPEKRKGCQACMSAGKCPAAVVAQRMAMSNARNLVPDDYGSSTPVTGKLRQDILERIYHVMVPQNIMTLFGLSTQEIDMVSSAEDRIAAQLGSAPAPRSEKATMRGGPRKGKKLVDTKTALKENANKITKIEQAASSGDLSAAL